MWGKQRFVEVQFVHYIKIQFCKVVLATNGRPSGLFTLTLNCCAMSPTTGSNRAEPLSVLGSNYSNKKYQLITTDLTPSWDGSDFLSQVDQQINVWITHLHCSWTDIFSCFDFILLHLHWYRRNYGCLANRRTVRNVSNRKE